MVSIIHNVVSVGRTWARRLSVFLLVLLGVATAAPAQSADGGTIEERVMKIRERFHDPRLQQMASTADTEAEDAVDQWANWPNWNNWRNWANWNNWRNWGNWGNWGNL